MRYRLLTLAIFLFGGLQADPRPWWEVNYNLDIEYPRMGDYRWDKASEDIILRGRGVNKRSFYKVDLASGDTTVYLDSSVFNYDGSYIPVRRWNLSKDGSFMLIQSKRERIWRHSNTGTYYLLNIDQREITKVSEKNEMLRNVKISPNNKWISYVRQDNNLYVYLSLIHI